jgi:protein-L-isoaspartate(D-aspartate) O-methyltransferase
MAWRCGGASNSELVRNLQSAGLIKSIKVAEAFAKVDRKHYVQDKRSAYQDSPSSIGHAATISAPHMHAYASEALLPYFGKGKSVLDIGSGSGYTIALFHHLSEDVSSGNGGGASEGKVIGIDHIPELVEQSCTNLRADGLGSALDNGRIEMVCGDGRQGWPQGAPYHAIHVGAAASNVTDKLLQQLAPEGRMFIPVEDSYGDQHIWQYDKSANGDVTKTRVMAVRVSIPVDEEHDRLFLSCISQFFQADHGTIVPFSMSRSPIATSSHLRGLSPSSSHCSLSCLECSIPIISKRPMDLIVPQTV